MNDKKIKSYLLTKFSLILISILIIISSVIMAHKIFDILQKKINYHNTFVEQHLINKPVIFNCDKPLYKNDIENLCDNNIDNKHLLKNISKTIKNTKNIFIYKHDSFDYQVNNKNSIECIVTYFDIKPGEKVPCNIDEDFIKIEIVRANIAK